MADLLGRGALCPAPWCKRTRKSGSTGELGSDSLTSASLISLKGNTGSCHQVHVQVVQLTRSFICACVVNLMSSAAVSTLTGRCTHESRVSTREPGELPCLGFNTAGGTRNQVKGKHCLTFPSRLSQWEPCTPRQNNLHSYHSTTQCG